MVALLATSHDAVGRHGGMTVSFDLDKAVGLCQDLDRAGERLQLMQTALQPADLQSMTEAVGVGCLVSAGFVEHKSCRSNFNMNLCLATLDQSSSTKSDIHMQGYVCICRLTVVDICMFHIGKLLCSVTHAPCVR